jgi:hypothetical protein
MTTALSDDVEHDEANAIGSTMGKASKTKTIINDCRFLLSISSKLAPNDKKEQKLTNLVLKKVVINSGHYRQSQI